MTEVMIPHTETTAQSNILIIWFTREVRKTDHIIIRNANTPTDTYSTKSSPLEGIFYHNRVGKSTGICGYENN